jgi:hypothetical protein
MANVLEKGANARQFTTNRMGGTDHISRAGKIFTIYGKRNMAEEAIRQEVFGMPASRRVQNDLHPRAVIRIPDGVREVSGISLLNIRQGRQEKKYNNVK